MEPKAFPRVRALLSSTAGSRFAASLYGVLTALLVVPIALILGLMLGLFSHHGRMPAWEELSPRAIARAEAEWASLDPSARNELVARLRLAAPVATRVASDAPPASGLEAELRWRALTAERAGRWVSPEATDALLPPDGSKAGGNFGILATLVRVENTPARPVVAALARLSPSSWLPNEHADANHRYLTRLFLSLMGLIVLLGVCLNRSERHASRATLETVTRLRRMVYHHSYRVGQQAVENDGTAEAIGLMTRHVGRVQNALHREMIGAIRNPLLLAVLLALAVAVDPILALVAFLLAGVVWAIGARLRHTFEDQAEASSRTAAASLGLLEESLGMMRLVKAYTMELFNQGRVERQLAEYARADGRRLRGEANARPNFVLLAVLGAAVFLFVAGRAILVDAVTLPGVLLLCTVLAVSVWPLVGLAGDRVALAAGEESAAVVFDFLDRRGDPAPNYEASFLPGITQSIELTGVSVREPGTGRVLLNDVSLSLPVGKRLAVLGSDDAERRALVFLLPRLIDPSSGTVRVDGRDLKGVTLDSLRAQVGVVLADHLVFNDTVYNNISCGDTSYTLPQVMEAAKLAHAHQLVQKLPMGYETPIGELGSSLKVGERFRIALARALLTDPAVLIIEEPSDGLDEITRALVDDTLRRSLTGRTVVLVSHRRSTLRYADTMLVLHKGRVEAVGDHRTLVESSPLYRTLLFMESNEIAESA